MALRSELFRGDKKLEAAAVSDPAHILPGHRGPHVAKIQQALIQVAGADLEADGIYGPATAAVVADFKRNQKPQILNFAGEIDNIVGIKTIAALDDGMVPKNPKPQPNALSRYCGNDRRTVPTLGGGFRSRLAFSVADGSVTGPPTETSLLSTVRQNAAQARVWLKSTLFDLNTFRLQVQIPPDQVRVIPTHARLKTHFLFDIDLFKNGPIIALKATPRNAEGVVSDLVDFYTAIDKLMSSPDRTFVAELRDLANTQGFKQFKTSAAFVPDPPNMDAIHVTPLYLDLGPLKRVAVLIHEAAHFVSQTTFQDIEHPRDPDYPGPQFGVAIKNVYSYEQLATHLFLRADRRLLDSE
jgi:hypothetical protein